MAGNNELSRSRRWMLGLILFLFVLAFGEIASLVFLRYVFHPRYERLFHYDFSNVVAGTSDEWIEGFKRVFDPELGWDYPPFYAGGNPESGCQGRDWRFSLDEIGSRETDYGARGETLIALYGGSYTFGAELNNDETWQNELSELTATKILNFGVGGYGMDQALLKLQRNLDRDIRTPIVILGVYSGGIERLVNVLRPFRTQNTDGMPLGFKPILKRRDDQFHWLESPLQSLDNRAVIEAAFEQATATDYWYAINERKPRLSFPYLVTLAHLSYFVATDYRESRNLWNNEDIGSPHMRELIRRFVELGRTEGFTLVVTFLPDLGDLERYAKGEGMQYQGFLETLRAEFSEDELTIVDVARAELDPGRFSKPGCHPSAYGSGIIATAVHEKIRHLVAAASDETAGAE